MSLPDPRDEGPDAESEDSPEAEGDLAGIQRPMDDPQTRPALDHDVDPPAAT